VESIVSTSISNVSEEKPTRSPRHRSICNKQLRQFIQRRLCASTRWLMKKLASDLGIGILARIREIDRRAGGSSHRSSACERYSEVRERLLLQSTTGCSGSTVAEVLDTSSKWMSLQR
jgi:hypothetical protein